MSSMEQRSIEEFRLIIISQYAGGDNKPSANIFFAAQSCSSGSPHDISSCWPPALVHRSSWPLAGYGFYSPGLICPSGYTSACTQLGPAGNSAATTSIGRSFNFQFPPIASETAIACCPTYASRYSTFNFSWYSIAEWLVHLMASVGRHAQLRWYVIIFYRRDVRY